jgi:hypothetical protein
MMLETEICPATVLFIENREKTFLYAAVARLLIERGYKIAWCVQNPAFASGLPGTVYCMPFPQLSDMTGEPTPDILITERGRDFFEAGSGHYTFYANQIAKVYEAVRPDIVIGECTLFHELLCIAEAEKRSVAYVHPTSERYPSGRFVLFKGQTQIPFLLSNDSYSQAEAVAYAGEVVSGKTRPFYMIKGNRIKQFKNRFRYLSTRLRIIYARWKGERFNTPSVLCKWKLKRKTEKNIRLWQQHASNKITNQQAILYPLQMQPESNIEIWGRPYHNQVEVIKKLLAAAPLDYAIALKANPKPKYEMSDELISLALDEDRIVLLPMDCTMAEAQKYCVGAITVSGTVGYEAVLGKGRCISLRHPIIDQIASSHTAESPEEAVSKLLNDPSSGKGALELGAALMQAIKRRSFPGMISDPVSHPTCMSQENIALVAQAIEKAIAFDAQSRASHNMEVQ